MLIFRSTRDLTPYYNLPDPANTIYIDSTLSGDITNGTYSISNRDNSGSDGNAFQTLPGAIGSVSTSTGNHFVMRGGTYTDGDGTTNQLIELPDSMNGTGWTATGYNKISSYPGEWTIIDGQSSAPKGVVLGYKDHMSSGQTKYWAFERIGITGGCSPGDTGNGGAGLWIAGGPIRLRFCHIYDNFDDSGDNNPSGCTFYRLGNSLIEYNFFEHNGFNGTNGEQVQMFTDYDDEAQSYTWGPQDITDCTNSNIIRYNLFDGGATTSSNGAFKYKGSQMLDYSDYASRNYIYKAYGDDVHHNILIRHGGTTYGDSTMLRQDYIQFHHNILVGPNQGLHCGQRSTWRRWGRCVYNNTLIDCGYREWFDDQGWSSQGAPFESDSYVKNNVIWYNAGSDEYNYAVMFWWFLGGGGVLPGENAQHITNQDFDNNYFYGNYTDSATNFHLAAEWTSVYPGVNDYLGYFTTSAYDTQYGNSGNYEKASSEGSDNLRVGASGADLYTLRSAHVMSGSTTLGNGGVNEPHPYLAGITIPSYMGANHPTDYAWIAGVLNDVGDYTWLRDQTSDPSWIPGEGA